MNITDTRGKRISFTGQSLDYKNYLPYSDTFIETGTAAGDGVQRALDAGFESIVSIEAATMWYDQCKSRFKSTPGIDIVFGKSTVMLPGMLAAFVGPLVIFLDAHPAGVLSAGHSDWIADPNGEWAQDNIIQAELRIILTHRPDHIIIIDDVNGMTDGCAEKYMDLCLAANPNYRFEFWSENLSGDLLYTDKILVCLPS
ncbi:MAG: hypothetical protein V4560_14730 [Bacteroidota bacterium]